MIPIALVNRRVVVFAAAGAVGCIAAQMAKVSGARVVGVAGGVEIGYCY